jgi:trimeric autotransporter adhesin
MKQGLLPFLRLALWSLTASSTIAIAMDTTFTYQGRLTEADAPYTGSAEFQPTLWDHASGGTQVAVNNPDTLAVGVTNGLFVLPLDFGPNFPGVDRWLQLHVRTTLGDFTLLAPRQKFTAIPYAQTAERVTGPLPAGQLSGTIDSANVRGVYANAVTFNNASNSFSGNGADLKGLNASQLTAGTVPDERLGAGIARTNQVWRLGGNEGTNPNNDFIGTTDAAALVLRAGNRPVLRLEGQSSGVRLIGGTANNVDGNSTNSSVLNGRDNRIDALAHESTIVGGLDNIIQHDQRSAFIGGGARNEIRQDNQYAVIAGGRDNWIGTNTVISLVVGGGENRIGNNVDGGLMVGGFRNDIIGSDNPNRRQIAPVLLGGSDNEIGWLSSWGVILGGDNNRMGTNCWGSVIAGGTNNLVADNCMVAFAAGRRARVNHFGAFVWSDGQNASFASAGENTFNIRAAGGMHLNGDTSQFFGSSVRQMINLWGTAYGIGVQSSTCYFRTDDTGSFSWFRGGTHANAANAPGTGGVEMMRLNSGGLRVNGTFVSASDQALKENFGAVNPREVLEKVAALHLSEWNYKQDPGTRHVGPMAQDFHAAFGVGTDDKTIATVDADGVALAAIQGLNQKVESQAAILQAKDHQIARLETELAELQILVRRLAQTGGVSTYGLVK